MIDYTVPDPIVMVNYSTYNPTTGLFVGTGRCAESYFPERSNVIEGVYDKESQYYDISGGAVADRPANQATIDKTSAVVAEAVTISNIPNPSTALVSGQTIEVTDGTLEMDFDLPGEYSIKIKSFPAQDSVFTVVIL